MKNIKTGPVRLYLCWIGLCLIFWLFIPVLSANSHTSAQVPFVLGTYAVMALICGTFLISLLNIFLFREWVKKFKYISGMITVSTGAIITWFLIKMLTL
ncbi:hypothetical protein SAMN04488522_105465 [Pedobacter caeni]|uniref:Uncharacterized protein n=1 Tax=Pedobacter caeni TaxID=288992 RepID=A0A1M5JQV0_9SPHI|nr:hypothetical protein SAMN04488522_105465 [Pedobacter caeni]